MSGILEESNHDQQLASAERPADISCVRCGRPSFGEAENRTRGVDPERDAFFFRLS
jgi:hypothetical protein